MKYLKILVVFFGIILTSCNGSDPQSAYVYNANPTYTWGYAEYFGSEYAEFGNQNHILSVSLFSAGLQPDSTRALTGVGQFLYFEDIYVPPTKILLPAGTYAINSTGLPYTVRPGKNDTVGNEVFPIGARITYYEENASKSKVKFITEGTFSVKIELDTIYTINCDFKTDDKKALKGSFTTTLPHYDESLKYDILEARKNRHRNIQF